MDKKTFYRSALMISLLVSACLALAMLPDLPKIGSRPVLKTYAEALASCWLYLAIFRNVRPHRWIRIILSLIPLAFLILGIISVFSYSRVNYWSLSHLYGYTVILPLLGWMPRSRNGIWKDLAICFALTVSCMTLRFFTGVTAGSLGIGIDYSMPVAYLYKTLLISSVLSVIALCNREDVLKVFDNTAIKWGCVILCLAFSTLALTRYGFRPYIYINGVNYGWTALIIYTPALWYAAVIIGRFFKALFSRSFPWKRVVFDTDTDVSR